MLETAPAQSFAVGAVFWATIVPRSVGVPKSTTMPPPTFAVLRAIVELVTATFEAVSAPPPKADGAVARFDANVEFVIVFPLPLFRKRPPPSAVSPASATLRLTVVVLIVRLEAVWSPPPRALEFPLLARDRRRFASSVVVSIVSVPPDWKRPPPCAVALLVAASALMRLPVTRDCRMTVVPLLITSRPPPIPCASAAPFVLALNRDPVIRDRSTVSAVVDA